jgi:AraC family transcriptional regulator
MRRYPKLESSVPQSAWPSRFRVYRAQTQQQKHRHERPHVSLIVAGTVAEESMGLEVSAGAGMFALRATGFEHQVRFGCKGALVLSAPVDSHTMAECKDMIGGHSWITAPEKLLRTLLSSSGQSDIDDLLIDVLASLPSARPEWPSAWLLRARDEMVEQSTSIQALAQAAGVHRVHFSRAFTRAFGSPPSVYRRRMAALRAISAAIEGRNGIESAYECGFADQSHMARVLKLTTGMSFGSAAKLHAKVTFVQD